MNVRIDIDDYHIRYGIPNTDSLCPVAIAAGPRIGGHVKVTSDGYIEVYDLAWATVPYPPRCPKTWTYWKQVEGGRLLAQVRLPPEIIKWMKAFDGGKPVHPISFEIKLPDDHFRGFGL